MKARIFCALLSAIVVVLCSCDGAKSTFDMYVEEAAATTADTTSTTSTKPNDPQYNGVQGTYIIVNGDTIEVTKLMISLGDSLITRELRFKLRMFLEGPDSLVVMDPTATVYTGTTGKPTTTEGNWILEGVDSLRTETTTSGFQFSYYQMSVTTTNKVGYTLICGRREAYEQAYLSTTFHRFNSVWEEENVVREDSIFRREVTNNEFDVTAKWDGGSRSFVLSKVVIIDHFVGMVEQEPEPETPTTVKADIHIKGLKKVLGAKRDLNRATGQWFDGVLGVGSEDYGSVELYPTYSSNGVETYTARTSHIVSMTVCPEGNYNGVAYLKGGIYPAYYTIDRVNMQWTYVSRISGTDAQDGFTEHKADILGIKNFQEDGTARVTPDLGFKILSEKTVNGYKVIEVLIKSYLGQWTKVTFADDALRPTGK